MRWLRLIVSRRHASGCGARPQTASWAKAVLPRLTGARMPQSLARRDVGDSHAQKSSITDWSSGFSSSSVILPFATLKVSVSIASSFLPAR